MLLHPPCEFRLALSLVIDGAFLGKHASRQLGKLSGRGSSDWGGGLYSKYEVSLTIKVLVREIHF